MKSLMHNKVVWLLGIVVLLGCCWWGQACIIRVGAQRQALGALETYMAGQNIPQRAIKQQTTVKYDAVVRNWQLTRTVVNKQRKYSYEYTYNPRTHRVFCFVYYHDHLLKPQAAPYTVTPKLVQQN